MVSVLTKRLEKLEGVFLPLAGEWRERDEDWVPFSLPTLLAASCHYVELLDLPADVDRLAKEFTEWPLWADRDKAPVQEIAGAVVELLNMTVEQRQKWFADREVDYTPMGTPAGPAEEPSQEARKRAGAIQYLMTKAQTKVGKGSGRSSGRGGGSSSKASKPSPAAQKKQRARQKSKSKLKTKADRRSKLKPKPESKEKSK